MKCRIIFIREFIEKVNLSVVIWMEKLEGRMKLSVVNFFIAGILRREKREERGERKIEILTKLLKFCIGIFFFY